MRINKNIPFIIISLFLSISINSFANDFHDFEVDGIYYNILSSTDKTVEVTYKGRNYDSYSNEYTGSVTIPETVTFSGTTYSVTSIGKSAFSHCSGLTSVTIGNSVTSIGEYAFYYCSGLTSVTIGNSVTSIGEGAFCYCSGLTSVTIPNSVTSIGSLAFYECSGLTSVTIGNSVTSIGGSAFYYCSGLTSVTIGNSVTEIGKSAFYGCSSLTSVTIPNSVTSIGEYAFYYCSGLTEVNYNSENCTSMGSYDYPVFKDCANLKTVNIGSSVEIIPDYAFYYCSGLTSVTIGNSVTSIGDYAFSGCSGLMSVTIPNSVTSIGYGAFSGCTGLTSVTIGMGVLSIGTYAFSYYDQSNLDIKKVIWLTHTPPEGYNEVKGTVNYVSNNRYSGLNNVTIYPYLSSIFEVDGIKYVPVSPSERTCDAIDCAYDSSATNINIGNTVSFRGVEMTLQYIKPYICYNNDYILDCKINFTGNIASNAFYDCDAITIVEIKTTAINSYAFSNSATLEVAKIEAKTIGNNAFSGCNALKIVSMGDGVETIGDWAFSGCSSLDSFSFGSGMKSIGTEAFSNCTAMTKLYSKAIVPPTCGSQALDDINKWNCELYVPQASIADYQVADQWKGFFFIKDIESGVEEVLVDGEDYSNAPIEIYNLSGLKVGDSTENLAPGVYIKRQGRKVEKIAIQ